MTQRSPLAAVLVLLATLAFAASPFLTDGFNGFTADQFPVPQVDVPVQPAGWAFSIWGPIYLWLIVGAVAGVALRLRSGDWAPMRWPLLVSLAVGAGWIPVAQISVLWATVMIWVMLLGALLALVLAGKADRWWQRAPVALYAGWLTAAACVSVGLMLGGYGWMGETAAAILSLLLALVIALTVQSLRPDEPLYALAVIWALAGVVAANLAPPLWPVLGLCGLGIAALTVRALRPA